jgi:hypothetical protein
VLEDTVAQLDDRLLVERQRVDRGVHRRVLAEVLEERHAVLRELRTHIRQEVAKRDAVVLG